MKGFFSKKETQSLSRPDGKIYSCVSCNLLKNSINPRMQPFGGFEKKILIVNSHPTDADDRAGKPLQGKDGVFLRRALDKAGIDLWKDCLVTHAVNCKPSRNKKGEYKDPGSYEIACCRGTLLQLIEKKRPHMIILLGDVPLASLIGHRWQKDLGKIHKWRGWCIPDRDFNAWICPVYHPSFAVQGMQEHILIFEKDLQYLAELWGTPFPRHEEITLEFLDDLEPLRTIPPGSMIAFDYETTGLKPHAVGHRIICAAVATSSSHAYAFMLPKTRKERQPFIDLLENASIRKIAANMKFEHAWSLVRLKTEVQNWFWDTMLASHLMDNRPGITGLKFQTYVRFGVVDYASDVAPFLKAKNESSANALNEIDRLIETSSGRDKLLEYCGKDAVFEYRLALLQMEELGYNDLPF